MKMGPFARIAALLVLGQGLSCAPKTPPPRSEPSFLLGERMPGFETQTMSGKRVASAAFERQAAVLVFAAVDCEACNRSLLAAQAAFDHYEEIHVVAVFQQEGSEKAKAVAAKLELGYPVVVDGDGTLSRQFRIQQVPRTFVSDADGLIRWVGGAGMTESELLAAVEAVPRR